MTAGATLYLVSACGSAEEFVAAFRRYADRTGLFIPSSAPLPAGRRGRLALTLKDGGVMIEGEAEIVQSSVKPTVLYGRPGMTIKFVGPDEPSRIVIGELEKARLAMKPVPPSVPPRPADVPSEPRPTVPALGGRIDAANALAECVVIGDASSLQLAGGAPRPVNDPPSGKSKFLPQGVPALGGRPRSPSTPPDMSRPRTPSTPPDLGSRPRTPSTPPDPSSKPLPLPSHVPASKLTSIGFPIIDKLPAATKPALVEPNNPLLKTTLGTVAPPNATRQTPSQPAPLTDDEATAIGLAPEHPVTSPKARVTEPAALAKAEVASETTEASSPPPPPPATTKAEPVEAAAEPAAPSGLLAPPPPPAPTPPPPRAPVAPLPSVSPSAKHKATSIGFPAIRTPFETQPLGVVPAPTGSEPAPPIIPRSHEPASPGPRGKNATRPPLTPRHPTPVAPVPIVRSPAKAAPHVEDETTELNVAMTAAALSATSPTTPETAVAAAAYTDAAKAADAAVSSEANRSGGMRASEILRAIPTADWTMSPDASKPTVLPSRGWTPAAGHPSVKEPPPDAEPTPAPSAPPGPPTGDWMISLDPEAPEAGWSAPEKIAKAPPAPPKPRHPTSGNPDIAVASEKPIQAQTWDDKPTSIGEAKIEIDPTLMEPLTPMPALDDDAADEDASAPGEPSPFAAAPPPRAATEQLAGIAPLGSALRMPSGGTPAVGSGPIPPSLVGNNPSGAVPLVGGPPGMSPAGATPLPPTPVPPMFGFAPSSAAAVSAGSGDNKRKLVIIAAAIAAIAAGFVLVLLLAGGKTSASNASQTAGSTSAGSATDGDPVGSGAGSGSAAVAADVPSLDAGVAEPLPDTPASTCTVTVTSRPAGAAILLGDERKGTTPGELELPCGTEAKVTLKKSRFGTETRSVTPDADKPNKLVVRLDRITFKLKVTSSPAGATIKAKGRSMGVTPATIRLPAYETTAIVLTKPGYATDSKKVTPKSNNTSHHFSLKKKGRR